MWTSRLGHSLRREAFNSNARTRRTRTRVSSTRWLPRCGPPAVLPRGRVLANRQRRCFKARLHVAGFGGETGGRTQAEGTRAPEESSRDPNRRSLRHRDDDPHLGAPPSRDARTAGLGGRSGRAVASVRDILHQFHRPGGLLVREPPGVPLRSEEHTSELQSRQYLVCRLLHEKKKTLV